MKKRGQVTLFIILGIILIILGILTYFLLILDSTPSLSSYEELNDEYNLLKSYGEDCLDNTLESALIIAGNSWGFIDLETDVTEETFIPIFYENGEKKVPSTNDIEESLAFYINEEFSYCLQISSEGSLTTNNVDNIETKVILNQGITVETSYEVSVEYQNEIISDKIEVESNNELEFEKFFLITSSYIDDYISFEGETCLDCLAEYSNEHSVTFSTITQEEYTIVTITDNTKLGGEDYEFWFAIANM